MRAGTVSAGVDVGGRRKGFHCAILRSNRLLDLACLPSAAQAADLLVRWSPSLIAIDSPKSLALIGEHSRRCERDFVKAGICNIRFTPDRAGLDTNPIYYEWIERGLELYEEVSETQPRCGGVLPYGVLDDLGREARIPATQPLDYRGLACAEPRRTPVSHEPGRA